MQATSQQLEQQAQSLEPRPTEVAEVVESGPSTDDVLAELFGETPTEREFAPEPRAEPAPAAEAAPPTPPEPEPAPEPTTPKSDPDFEKLVQREQMILQREAQIREYEQDLSRIDTQLARLEEARNRAAVDPISYLREIAPDLDLSQLARDAWYAYKGEEAPPEHRLQREVRALKYEQEKLREQTTRRDKQQSEAQAAQASQQAVEAYRGGLSDTLGKLPSGKYLRVQKLAKQSADKAVGRALDHASRVAAQSGKVLNFEEAFAALEQDLADIGYEPEPAAEPQQPQATTPQRMQAPGTLRNQHSSVQPSHAEVNPDDPEVLRRQALEAVGLDIDDPSVRRYYTE